MEKITTLVHQIEHKQSEIDYHSNQKQILQSDLYILQEDFKNLCKKYISDNSENIFQNHIHFKDNHIIEVSSTYYYDVDWYRDTYGKRYPQDSYGRPYEYEGPDTLMYVICSKCDQYFTHTYKKEFEKIIDDNQLGLEIFKKGLLEIERINMEKTFLKNDC